MGTTTTERNPVIERKKIAHHGAVKLIQRIYENGDITFYLDKNENGARRYEFLNDFKIRKGTSAKERSEYLAKAKKIAIKRADEINSDHYGLTNTQGRNVIMVEWMQDYIKKYTKSDVRNMQGALNRFINFLSANKFSPRLTFGQLTGDHVTKYIDYLKKESRGEGAASYYARFKKMMNTAKAKNFFAGDPFLKIHPRFDEAESREVLDMEEIRLLDQTSCNSDVVRRAAIFSCMTGFAWTDVKHLTWEMIKTDKWTVRKPRQKTNSKVFINLNPTAKKMIGEPGNPKDFVFNLPSANGCNKTLKAWVKRAGIKKKIRWHELRHSFGTNLAMNGTPIIEIRELMGHKTLKYTERYVKASQDIMQRATDNLTI